MEIISLARLHMLPASSPHGAGSFLNKDCREVLMLPRSCYLEKAPNQVKGSQLITKCNSSLVSPRHMEASGGAWVCVRVHMYEQLGQGCSEMQRDLQDNGLLGTGPSILLVGKLRPREGNDYLGTVTQKTRDCLITNRAMLLF